MAAQYSLAWVETLQIVIQIPPVMLGEPKGIGFQSLVSVS